MPLRTISSAGTALYKFVVPVLALGGFVYLYVIDQESPSFSDSLQIVFLLIFVSVVFFTFWQAWTSKVVSIDKQNGRIYVSNYFKEIEVPITDVAFVTESRLTKPRRITLHFRHPTEFGDRIIFLAKHVLFLSYFAPHPIMAELQDLVGQDPGNWRAREWERH